MSWADLGEHKLAKVDGHRGVLCFMNDAGRDVLVLFKFTIVRADGSPTRVTRDPGGAEKDVVVIPTNSNDTTISMTLAHGEEVRCYVGMDTNKTDTVHIWVSD